MKYLALIYQAPNALDNLTEAEYQALLDQHNQLQIKSKAEGRFVVADRLEESSSATTLSRPDGKLMISDGPFSETKEVLVGYYLFDCDHLDQAIELAGMIPMPNGAKVEVRPVKDHIE